MSNFPNSFDDDTTLPVVNDNITQTGGQAINALRDFAFNVEQYLGLGLNGTMPSLAVRLGVSINPDGTLNSSMIASMGLVTLPITQDQIATNADIPENKLRLDYRTGDLFNYIRDLSKDVNNALGWISTTGIQLEPHLIGAIYRHSMDQIDVSHDLINFPYLQNKFRLLRNNTQSYYLVNDMNSELLAHQWADGSPFGTLKNVVTNNGSQYPDYYAHVASGIFLESNGFGTIPQTVEDLQSFAEYIDQSSIFLFGTRIQNFYSNGISVNSRSSVLNMDGYGQGIVPVTAAITYLGSTGPVDNILTGDDIIKFVPNAGDGYLFNEQFSLVKVGDIVRVNYGTIETQFVIKEKKYTQQSNQNLFTVRIAGKNLFASTTATARIDRPLFNHNKYGVLASAVVNNNTSVQPSLIIGSPRGAQALGLGFNPDQFDNQHYLLYLALFPTGNPSDGYTILPPVDVTGDQGRRPGLYTLDSIVSATNNAFRQPGFNYRFIAFELEGQFGIMLADSYNNSGFAIMSAVVAPNGFYDKNGTNIAFSNNVIDVFGPINGTGNDPLGFGPLNSNLASPPYMGTWGSAIAAQNATKLFIPLKRNTYYVNGTERERLTLDVGQALDQFGDGYWVATIDSINVVPGSRVEATYKIPLNLSTSNLVAGKTVVVQSLGGDPGLSDYGRFIISNIIVECSPNTDTKITVYDCVHATGVSPPLNLPTVGSTVAIYFNSDSVSFNAENSSDLTPITGFKRYFEGYIDQNGNTYTAERARMFLYTSGLTPVFPNAYTTINSGANRLFTSTGMSNINMVEVSPKLRGYQYGLVNKITLTLTNFDVASGNYDGYLCKFDDIALTTSNRGPITKGTQGQVTRFYDETNVDYIDFVFDVNSTPSVVNNQLIDIQLFPTLSLDEEIMLLNSCQITDSAPSPQISYLTDRREFGNVSEEQFSTSAIKFISTTARLLTNSGVIRGFDKETISTSNPNNAQIYLTGGEALVNGNFIQMDAETITIPLVQEYYNSGFYNINWILCVNDQSEYELLPLLDYDSTIPTPNAPNRLVTTYNVINGQTYRIPAILFSNLINIRKDLAPLFIIASTVTSGSTPTISVTTTDARRYVNDLDTNFPLKLTSANAQGNFKSPVAILNWIKYNNAYNGTAIVKGATASSGIINTILNLNFSNTVSIDGQDDAILTFNSAVTLGSNLTFQNLNLIFNGGISVATGTQNLILNNCNITINLIGQAITSPLTQQYAFRIINGDNISITNCTFTINFGTNTTAGAVFRLENTTNFFYDSNPNMEVVFANVVGSGTSVPGDVFQVVNSPGAVITNSAFGTALNSQTNFGGFFRNTSSNNFTLQNLNVSSIYQPYNPISNTVDVYNSTTDPQGIIDGLPVVNYTIFFPWIPGGDLVNSGRGWIYSNITGVLDSCIIDNVQFSCNPTIPFGGYQRFSYINFELSTLNSIFSNIKITNNKFISLGTGGQIEDARPAIAVINTSPSATSVQQQPSLKNVYITNNYCNRSQHIILTSKLGAGNMMVYPGLYCQNVTVQDNTCGTVGYWVSAGSKVINFPPNANSLSDKTSGLIISDNVCHEVTNVDSTGKYFLVSKPVSNISTNMSKYPSGYVTIRDNSCNWIHTGIAFEENSSLDIIDNSLTAYDVDYLIFVHGDGYIGADGYPNAVYDPRVGLDAPGLSTGYAIFASSNKKTIPDTQAPGEGNDSSVRIAGNTVGTGYWLETTTFNFIYNYFFGYIYSQSSVHIEGNNLRGVGANGGSLVLVGGLNSSITNNKIYRSNNVVFSYISFANFDTISPGILSWNGAEAAGIVTGNFFDSPYTDNVTINTNNNLFTEGLVKYNYVNTAVYKWSISNNKNQTGYMSIGMTSQLVPYGYAGYAQGGIGAAFDGYYNTNFYMRQAFTTNIVPVPPGVTLNSSVYRSLILHLHDNDILTPRFIGWQETIDKFIPQGARLVLIQMGVKPFETVVTTTASGGPVDSRILMTLNKYGLSTNYINLDYLGTVADAVPDVNVINEFFSPLSASSLTGAVTGGQINSSFNTFIMTVDTTTAGPGSTDVSNYFVSGGDTAFGVSIDIVYQRASGITTDLGFSPLFVKFRW